MNRRLLFILLVLQSAHSVLSDATKFIVDVSLNCDRNMTWCFEAALMEDDEWDDDELAATHKICLPASTTSVHKQLIGREYDDGLFDYNAEIYTRVTHNCTRNGRARWLRFDHGTVPLIEDLEQNFDVQWNILDSGRYANEFTFV